jgi:hypothetical protein
VGAEEMVVDRARGGEGESEEERGLYHLIPTTAPHHTHNTSILTTHLALPSPSTAVEMITGGRYLCLQTMSAQHLRRTFCYMRHHHSVQLAKLQLDRAKERAKQLKDANTRKKDADDEDDEDGEDEDEDEELKQRALLQSAVNRPHQLLGARAELESLVAKERQLREDVVALREDVTQFGRSSKIKAAKEAVSLARIDYSGVINSKEMKAAREAVSAAKKVLVAAGGSSGRGKAGKGRGRLCGDGGKLKVLGEMKKVRKALETLDKEQNKRLRERQRQRQQQSKGAGKAKGGAAEKAGDKEEPVAEAGERNDGHTEEDEQAEAAIEKLKARKAVLEPELQVTIIELLTESWPNKMATHCLLL